MKHALVSLSGAAVSVHVAVPPATPVTMLSPAGVDYTPDKFDVLENVFYNAQHGWLPDGPFNELPLDDSIWIKRTGASQPDGSTFNVYEGGNMMEGMDAWSMSEIYWADGVIWQWDAVMQHDCYTADMPGSYSMSFEVYVGDSEGNPTAGFTAATTTFEFVAVPEPIGSAWVLLFVSSLLVRQRRGCL